MNLSWVDIVDPYFGEAMFTKCGLAWSREKLHSVTAYWRCSALWDILEFGQGVRSPLYHESEMF